MVCRKVPSCPQKMTTGLEWIYMSPWKGSPEWADSYQEAHCPLDLRPWLTSPINHPFFPGTMTDITNQSFLLSWDHGRHHQSVIVPFPAKSSNRLRILNPGYCRQQLTRFWGKKGSSIYHHNQASSWWENWGSEGGRNLMLPKKSM